MKKRIKDRERERERSYLKKVNFIDVYQKKKKKNEN